MASDITKFYKNQNVFVTGATGFVGKCLTEKLLRSCEIGNIYLLVRRKKEASPMERFAKILESPIFDKLKEDTNAQHHKKMYLIEGNINEEYLGISEENRKMITEQVNIVFHCASSLNMNSHLQEAASTNVKGYCELMRILKEMKQLKACQIVSTAFSNCTRHVIEEKLYDPPIRPELLLDLINNLSPKTFNRISRGLQGEYPNSYIYTKAVGEGVLVNMGNKLPVGLFRPAIITSAYKEPIPGFIDNIYGPISIGLASGLGILRVINTKGTIKSHVAPVDMVVNALICSVVEVYQLWKSSADNGVPVYNFSSINTQFHISGQDYINLSNSTFVPSRKCIWKHILYFIPNVYMYYILAFFLHTIPTYMMDGISKLLGKKSVLRKIYSKVDKALSVLHFFIVREWEMKNDNVLALWEKLNDHDKELFNFDLNSVDMRTYFVNMNMGIKKFIIKDNMSPEDIEKDRNHCQRLVILHYATKYLLLATAVIFLWQYVIKVILKY